MYEYELFNPPQQIVDWTDKHQHDFFGCPPMAKSDAKIVGCSLSPDVGLRYELHRRGAGYGMHAIHAMVYPWRDTLRDYNFKLLPAFRPKNAIIWHTKIDRGKHSVPLVIAIPEAGIEPTFSAIRAGGIFSMQITGLVYHMTCRNNQSTLRLHDGPTLDMRRQETNDPTLEYVDLTLSHQRSIKGLNIKEAPALAEFDSVVEFVEKVEDGEWPSYRLLFWSGQPEDPSSFPVQAIVPKHLLQANHYTPRVGDAISGQIALFGNLPSEDDLEADPANRLCHDEPWAFFPANSEAKPPADAASKDAPSSHMEVLLSPSYDLLPRPLEIYPEVEDFGQGLARRAASAVPHYVLYRDYHRAIQGELRQLPPLPRKHLRAILEQIPQLFRMLHKTAKLAVLDSANLLHIARDPITGERHLWVALAPASSYVLVHTNLLIAIDDNLRVLRYTLLTEDKASAPYDFWILGFRWKTREKVPLTSFQAVEDFIHSAKVNDFIGFNSIIYSTMFQAYLQRNGWHIEWYHRNHQWKFKCLVNTTERLIELMHIYIEKGLVPLQTMEKWKFSGIPLPI